jgi:hypothetical protein
VLREKKMCYPQNQICENRGFSKAHGNRPRSRSSNSVCLVGSTAEYAAIKNRLLQGIDKLSTPALPSASIRDKANSNYAYNRTTYRR